MATAKEMAATPQAFSSCEESSHEAGIGIQKHMTKKKYITRDNKCIKIKIDSKDNELMNLLNNIVPRLSYDEIIEGELEKRLKKQAVNIESVELSTGLGIKELLLSKAIFDAISKPTGM